MLIFCEFYLLFITAVHYVPGCPNADGRQTKLVFVCRRFNYSYAKKKNKCVFCACDVLIRFS